MHEKSLKTLVNRYDCIRQWNIEIPPHVESVELNQRQMEFSLSTNHFIFVHNRSIEDIRSVS